MRKRLNPVMFAGTGSDVGKSVLSAAFCRIFLQDGYHPAPFKAQNMSLNSYVTSDGMEISKAQAVQASACKIECSADMNPILLKPVKEMNSQVILNGKPFGNSDAYSYFKKDGRDFFRNQAHIAYQRLAAVYNPIVIEGAGSIAEINLKEMDIVNMSMAIYCGASVILVADIDRGGVFASLYGSVMLLDPEERKYIKGIIINKFRGDIRLFESGIKQIERLCNIPVLGVIPYFNDIYIEAEDSLSLLQKKDKYSEGSINVAVVRLNHISNFTDYDLIGMEENVNLYYSNDPMEISKAEVIILPGSKNTIEDMDSLWKEGIAEVIINAREKGKTVIGICGGYQMMGRQIEDPLGIEGKVKFVKGLDFFPLKTVMGEDKVLKRRNFRFLGFEEECIGYEIHNGVTLSADGEKHKSLNIMEDGTEEGFMLDSKCFGSYMHGILDNKIVIDYLLKPFGSIRKVSSVNYALFREEQFEKLAEHVRTHIDMQLLYKILTV